MARIGDYTVDYCLGALVHATPRTGTWVRPGYAGRGVHYGPRDAVPQLLPTLTFVSDLSAALLLYALYVTQAESEIPVDIEDGLGQTWRDVRLMGCLPGLDRPWGALPYGPCAASTAGGKGAVVGVQWVCLLSHAVIL